MVHTVMKFAFVALSTGFLAFVADAVEASISDVCTDTSNTNNVDDSCHYAEQDDDDVLTAQLIDWLRDNGAYINEKLAIKQLDPSLPRGLYAMEDMEAGETVCKIPWALILKPTAEELANGSVREELSDCGTIEAVFHAITVDEDNMTPYGRYLLNRPKAYTAPFWSQAAQDLLQHMLKSKKEQQMTEFDALPPHGVDELIDEVKSECNIDTDDEMYRHAAMLVKTRADYHVMVPFYDMMNHHNGHVNVAHVYNPYAYIKLDPIEQTGYEIVTTKPIKASEQLYLSYNHCKICSDYLDWFGTPEMFAHFGFVEPLPQRWLFDFARVKFDLSYKVGNDATGEIVVNFLVPPSEKGIALLLEELTRLESFSSMHQNMDYESAGISSNEWQSLWQYYNALHDALSYAVEQSKHETLTEDVWKLDDNWWVQDGTLSAADVDEHLVQPTTSK